MNKKRKSLVLLGAVSSGVAVFAVPSLRSDTTLFEWMNPLPRREYMPIRDEEKMPARRPHAQPQLPQNMGASRFGAPLPGLTREQLEAFGAGEEEFTNVEDIEGGLGPIFNEASCVACHFTGGVGGASDIFVTRFGRQTNGAYDPLETLGGSLLQRKAIVPEVREIVPREANIVVRRQTTPLFGLGLIEAIPDAAIEQNAIEQSRSTRAFRNNNMMGNNMMNRPGGPPHLPLPNSAPNAPPRPNNSVPPNPARPTSTPTTVPSNNYGGELPIRGRVAQVLDVVSGQTRVGRFGWKGQQASILAFSGDAYLNEMGITNRFFPHENAPNGDVKRLAAFDMVKDIEDEADPSSGLSDIDASADFMRFLAAPPQRPLSPSANAGRMLFESTQCATCHKPMMMTGPNSVAALDRKPVWLYSDLLLHDMGALGDGIAQADAGPREFRTPPLWGLRASAPYLHDGRARTIEEAIRAHDGQGAGARNCFLQLTLQQRQQLLEFLGSI
jgi:CxxC motif-containing protein (DUF1111 family)